MGHRTQMTILACIGVGLLALGAGCGGGGGPGAPTATVQGRVVDVATLSVQARAIGVQGAEVILRPTLGGADRSGTSDSNGDYTVRKVPGGNYYVFVTPPSGYAPPSDPDADPSNGIAEVTVPTSGTMTLPDIALAVIPDFPPDP